VLIQLGASPEFSLNDSHILSDVIRLCGGINVFGDSPAIAPRISTESILAAKPDLVIIGADKIAKHTDVTASARAFWKKAGLEAARNDHVYGLDADVIFRPGPRLIEQAETICKLIEQART
jgi:iron complex transport system substrate-binding protein/vitamin B12 transport system substrate-binding protein